MSIFHSPSVVVGTLVLLASLPTTTHGHVQLAYPPAIIDDDYQYTFDGSCQYDSCDVFCGRAGPDPIPVTSVVPGKLALKLNVNVKHPPFRYRVALSSASDALPGFDKNILLDDIEAPGDGSTEFEVIVDIPEDVDCSPFCTLQLFDYYYFVSCARIIIRDPDTSGVMETTNSSGVTDSSNIAGDTTSNALPQYDVPSEVTFSRESTNDGTVMINATVVLADKSWFGIALSQTGAMIGSQALIGLPNATSNGTSVQEYDLAGKFTEAIQPIDGVEQLMGTNASFGIAEDSFGNYMHTVSASFNAADVCGTQLIWAHANPNGATDVLGYHGTYRGVLGTIECAPQSSPSTAGNGDSVVMQGRDQDGAATTSAAALMVVRSTAGTLLMAGLGLGLLAM